MTRWARWRSAASPTCTRWSARWRPWSAGSAPTRPATRIGAWDADPEPPEPPAAFGRVEELEEGRGLALVRACADVWGWHPLARHGNRGKYVWCELASA
ncbi:ATP-binding protein [Streptomyces sp. WG4]|uniref:ATP-binding protein n=1 Tax=Streptomyces sp. WG4 TaxID=3417649 RepID=UPI003CF3AB36